MFQPLALVLESNKQIIVILLSLFNFLQMRFRYILNAVSRLVSTYLLFLVTFMLIKLHKELPSAANNCYLHNEINIIMNSPFLLRFIDNP